MKQCIVILFSVLLLMASSNTVEAQKKVIKRGSQKTEQTSKSKQKQTQKTNTKASPKHKLNNNSVSQQYSSDIEYITPNVDKNYSNTLTVESVILNSEHTAINFSANNKEQQSGWMHIDPKAYIVANGKKYYLNKAERIKLYPEKTFFSYLGQTLTFTLYFPAIPLSTTSIDFVESESSEWRVLGIQLHSSSKQASKSLKSKSSVSNVINVSTEEQFLNALGSDRTILIQKSINLSSIINYELTLYGYNNLTIKGVNSSIRLGVSNGENLVMYLDSCENISISNLVLGHEDVLWCGAGVLMFYKCSGVNISNCDIYGCGYYGITMSKSNNIVCEGSNLHNCWVYMLGIYDSQNVYFKNTMIKESGMGTLISVHSSNQIQFDNCSFIDDTHTGKEMYGHKCFNLDCNITLKNCSIHYTNTYGDTNFINQSNCKWY